MIRKSIPLAIAALGVAFAATGSASAQSLGKLGNSLNRGQPMMQTGNWGPSLQTRDMGRRPSGPQIKPPGWQPSFSEKSAGLKGYVDKGQPLGKTDNSLGVMKAPPKYDYPKRPPRRPGHGNPTLSDGVGKLDKHLSKGQPMTTADGWTPTLRP